MVLCFGDRHTRGATYSHGSGPCSGYLSCWLTFPLAWLCVEVTLVAIHGEHEQGQVTRQRCQILQGALVKGKKASANKNPSSPSQICFWQQHMCRRLEAWQPWADLLWRLLHTLVWNEPSSSWGIPVTSAGQEVHIGIWAKWLLWWNFPPSRAPQTSSLSRLELLLWHLSGCEVHHTSHFSHSEHWKWDCSSKKWHCELAQLLSMRYRMTEP